MFMDGRLIIRLLKELNKRNKLKEILRMIPGIKRLELFLRDYFSCIKTFGKFKYAGEWSQDRIAYLYFKGKRTGFFMDIGAHDGISGSNTYIFEQLGWRGICIEPQEDIFKQLQRNRKCDTYNVAIYIESLDNADFIKINNSDYLSGLSVVMSDDHKALINKNSDHAKYMKVKTMSFDDVMKNYQDITYIDFISLDVEGAELSILQSIDFLKYKFGLMAIENNEADDILIKFMETKNYRVLLTIGNDILFVSNYKP